MNDGIDIDLVRHIGRLSRIELTEPQVEAFGRQMASILQYFDKLKELDTDKVEPLVYAVELSNVLADDVPQPSLSAQQALANAPDHDGDFFKVPNIME
jgi:aspartyl-tRNA(Asn)/glutamyl-tRNA(Gln) amidotransferase subunit C